MKFIACLFVCLSVAASEIQGFRDMKSESGKSFREIITKIELMESRTKAKNVTVEADVFASLIEKGKPKNYDLSSTIIGFSTGHLRIKVSYGMFNVMDLGIGASKAILSLRDGGFFAGTVQEAKESGQISKIAANELSGNKFLFPEIWDERAESRVLGDENGQPVVYVFRRQAGKEEVIVIKKVYLEAIDENYFVKKVVRYDDNMMVCGIIEYSGYEKRTCELKKGTREEVIPTKVTVRTDDNTSFAFTVTKVKLDKEKEEDAEKATNVKIPDDVTPKAFSDITPAS